jgi:hypothetical protein
MFPINFEYSMSCNHSMYPNLESPLLMCSMLQKFLVISIVANGVLLILPRPLLEPCKPSTSTMQCGNN